MIRALARMAATLAVLALPLAAPAAAGSAGPSLGAERAFVPPPAFRGEAQLLVDEADLVPAILAMIARARRSVLVDYFIFGGPAAGRLVDALIERRRAGVAVAVLLDPALGSLPAIKAACQVELERLRAAGIAVRLFAPPPLGPGATPARDHAKVVAVDGEEAVVSSMNLGGALLVSHDLGVWLTGMAAREIARDARAAFERAPQTHPEGGRPWPKPEPPEARGESQLRVLATDPAHPDPAWQPTRPALLTTIHAARRGIDVMMLKLTDPDVLAALAAAAARGVAVRVLLDPGRHGRLLPGGWAPEGLYNLAAARQLADAGVAVRWYRPRPAELALHAKAAGFDGRALLIGTPNWTDDGFRRNRETAVLVTGGPAPLAFAPVFEEAWTHRSDAPAFLPGPLLGAQLGLYGALTRLAD